MAAVSYPVAILLTALLGLVLSLCIYTDVSFTLRVPVRTIAENAFRFMSNPMVTKESHPNVVTIKINSQRRIPEPEGEYFNLAITDNIPVFGHHTFINEMWTNKESLTISNIGYPLWSILKTNVTWTVLSDGDSNKERCHIEERCVTTLPWLLSFYVKAEQERVHRELLRKAQRTLERLGGAPGRSPGSRRDDLSDPRGEL